MHSNQRRSDCYQPTSFKRVTEPVREESQKNSNLVHVFYVYDRLYAHGLIESLIPNKETFHCAKSTLVGFLVMLFPGTGV